MILALGPVEEVHPVLEPARDRTGVARKEHQTERSQYAPHRKPTREGQRISREAEEVKQLLAVRAAQQTTSPEREQYHARTGAAGGGWVMPCSSSWYARWRSSMSASLPRSWRTRERCM